MEREARRSKRRRTGSGARVDVGKAEGGKEGEGEGEGFWARVTRRVIRDLMGIDEELLEVILGEALPDVAEMREEEEVGEDMEGSWQARLLDRIARELGLLVHHLRASESAAHPGAFTTYPPSAPPLPQASTIRPTPQPSSLDTSTSDQEPIFAPTLAFNPPDATLWGIEEEPSPGADAEAAGAATAGDTPIDIAEREFWERDLALGTVFAYLKARFQGGELPLPSSLPAGSGAAAGPSAVSPSSPPASGREEGLGSGRAAREGREGRMAWVRRVHPLATAAPTGPVVGRAFAARARSESCASQSSRLSKRTGSSRNYWDIGGSGSGEIGFGV
ncbi:hypothetical protein EJ06DRAFT_528350 [Trichodelitschia bisporula]|uniref:Uncharacterized protein n=1 Tax=Trichodelitschia bisporula TaxID=703511 RepID=A0A6G1I287_9PEZI|nr:hypothetical protein EJ06DRAFT_528350 [Trichodelitschia bisporula]